MGTNDIFLSSKAGCCPVAQSCPTPCDPTDCSTPASLSFSISWSLLRLTPIVSVMPGKSHGQRSLVGYSPWNAKEPQGVGQAWVKLEILGNGWRGYREDKFSFPQPRFYAVYTQLLKGSESESRSAVSISLQGHRLYSPWNSPGQNTGVGSLSLLRGIFPTQGSNPGLPHCRRILHQLSMLLNTFLLEPASGKLTGATLLLLLIHMMSEVQWENWNLI